MANSSVLEGRWSDIRGRIKEMWSDVSESELDRIAGQKDRIVGLLQDKYGYSARKAEQEVDRLVAGVKEKSVGTMEDLNQVVTEYPWAVPVAAFVVSLVVGSMFLKTFRH